MLEKHKNVLVTGGAGFIGANFIDYLLNRSGYAGAVVNIDNLSYAGNPDNLAGVALKHGGNRYHFEKIDIRDQAAVADIFKRRQIDAVCHFAAESHVDRSIHGPRDFVETNVLGTFNLLEAARAAGTRFHHVSTDEVYGSLGAEGHFYESTPYDPRSPYSASKAGSDHLVRAYHHTYGLPSTISNCSNNYGPRQFPEKVVPLMILNALEGKPLPVYGDGRNVRDWLHVDDHCAAVAAVLDRGRIGETYNVGGECELENLELVRKICAIADRLAPRDAAAPPRESLITFVKDRPGHDRRYAINCDKIKGELGWRRGVDIDHGLELTVRWYLDNPAWIARIRSGEYQNWMEKNYGGR